MEGNQPVDLRLYDLCRNKLQLSEGDAAAVSQEIQELINEETSQMLKQYLETDRTERRDFEEFIEQRIEFVRKDVHNMHAELHAELQQVPSSGGQYTDIMQWMFTYFAFLMGGLVAVILLLLKR